jgi:hypothetical protein
MIPKLSGPILAGILVLGVLAVGLSFDDAEAKKTQFTTPKVGDEIGIKAKGTGICTSDEDSGTVKANVRFLLQVTEADGDISNGVGKAKMKLNATCEGAPRELETDGSLAFTLDNDNRILTMSGVLIDKDGITYSIDGVGQINEGKKTTVDMDLAIVSDPGVGVTFTIPVKGDIKLLESSLGQL